MGEEDEAEYWGRRALEIAERELPAGSPELARFGWPPQARTTVRI